MKSLRNANVVEANVDYLLPFTSTTTCTHEIETLFFHSQFIIYKIYGSLHVLAIKQKADFATKQ